MTSPGFLVGPFPVVFAPWMCHVIFFFLYGNLGQFRRRDYHATVENMGDWELEVTLGTVLHSSNIKSHVPPTVFLLV